MAAEQQAVVTARPGGGAGSVKGRGARKRSNYNLYILGLLICAFVTLNLSFLHGSIMMQDLSMPTTPALLVKPTKKQSSDRRRNDLQTGPLAGLSCEKYGGPSPEVAQEMVYWSDIPSDAQYVSPFQSKSTKQYMTFEPDGGGWNNIRMSMETVLAMAHAMGRTLVLPPEQKMYLLAKSDGKQRKDFSFNDFFHMDRIDSEHDGLQIITMDEFLTREAGQFRNLQTGEISFPPYNRTNWNGMSVEVKNELNPWLRSVTHMPTWNCNQCVASFAASPSAQDMQDLATLQELVPKPIPTYHDYIGHPVPVDAPALDRLLENWAGRSELCIYDQELQQAKVVHFHGNKKLGARLLVHFYAFLFFQDWKQDLWMKRFVRDHVRYIDELQCAAARIVDAVRDRARTKGTSPDGDFDTFHIRRGDFQYKVTRLEAAEIYEMAKDVIPEGATVYIGTDERNKTFFQPLKDHYDVVFLDDFMHLIEGVNTNYYGMLDQLIASRGRYFFGCWFSTFTGYINRLRGYHSVKLRLPGYEDGVIESYYYALAKDKMAMREYVPVKQAFHAREFPASWRNIDEGITELVSSESR